MYILIIILGFNGSVATTTAEFQGIESCNYAAERVKTEAGLLTKVRTICIPKVKMKLMYL